MLSKYRAAHLDLASCMASSTAPTAIRMQSRQRRSRFKGARGAGAIHLAPLAGRGRREAPGEGLSPRVPVRREPLTPTLSPRRAGRGSALQRRRSSARSHHALLDERAALLPWSGIENRAVDLAGGVAREGDPRMIAALDVEFILRKVRHGHRLALVKIEDRPAACGFNDELAVRDTDLKLRHCARGPPRGQRRQRADRSASGG